MMVRYISRGGDKRWRLFGIMATRSLLQVEANEITGGNIFCRVCGKRFRKWNGTARHGVMHVDRGEAIAEPDPHCPPSSGARYNFFLTYEML